MPGYRTFQLDSAGHILDRAEFVQADDVAAVETARECFPSGPIETWEGDRLVETSALPQKTDIR